MPDRRPWPPDRVAEMRRGLLAGDVTLSELADREGVAKQRIQKLIGPLHGGSYRARRKRRHQRLREFFRAGRSDAEIASELGFAEGTVSQWRRELGLKRGPYWTEERIITKAQWWYERYGSLNATDWNPSMLKARGRLDLVRRFYESGAPHVNTAQNVCGSWLAMKQKAGIPISPVQAARLRARAGS